MPEHAPVMTAQPLTSWLCSDRINSKPPPALRHCCHDRTTTYVVALLWPDQFQATARTLTLPGQYIHGPGRFQATTRTLILLKQEIHARSYTRHDCTTTYGVPLLWPEQFQTAARTLTLPRQYIHGPGQFQATTRTLTLLRQEIHA